MTIRKKKKAGKGAKVSWSPGMDVELCFIFKEGLNGFVNWNKDLKELRK